MTDNAIKESVQIHSYTECFTIKVRALFRVLVAISPTIALAAAIYFLFQREDIAFMFCGVYAVVGALFIDQLLGRS